MPMVGWLCRSGEGSYSTVSREEGNAGNGDSEFIHKSQTEIYISCNPSSLSQALGIALTRSGDSSDTLWG